MHQALQAQLGALGDEVRATAIPTDRQGTALWCLGQVPALYAGFLQTNESRYGDEITRLFQGLLKALTGGENLCPKARELAASLPERLQLLHQQLGLPRLALKSPRAPLPRSRKVR